jgi:branched-chain amino acid transport system substrate-binding protein
MTTFKKSYQIMIGFLFLGLVLSSLSGCAQNKPIKIGLSAELTGTRSNLSLQVRNGVQLAVEQINAAGGIDGRPFALSIQDDLGTPEGALVADQALVDAGVIAIIGHTTSSQTVAAYSVTEEANVILFSPSASTPDLNEMKDHFFRILVSSQEEGSVTAQYILEERGISQVAVIYDERNKTYALPVLSAFEAYLNSQGGQIVSQTSFSSSEGELLQSIVTELKETSADGLYIIATPIDTAFIAQQAQLQEWPAALFAVAWAHSNELIVHGGSAVEDLAVILTDDPNNPAPESIAFVEQYHERFGKPPELIEDNAYDVVNMLAQALEKTNGKAAGLEAALLEIQNFPGINGSISMDVYGEARVDRDWYVVQVKNGQFVTTAEIK